MDNNSGLSGSGNSWPPPPAAQPGTWPPPPTAQPTIIVPFRTLFRRVEGTVPNFRTGSVCLGDSGVTIQGKSVLPYEQQIPIMILCWFVSLVVRFVFLIAYVVLEYAIRREETLPVAWNQVRQIVLVPKSRIASIVYDAPNHKGIAKTYSLTFRLTKITYDPFVAAAIQYIPGRVAPGKVRAWTSPRVWIVLVGLVLILGVSMLIGYYGRDMGIKG